MFRYIRYTINCEQHLKEVIVDLKNNENFLMDHGQIPHRKQKKFNDYFLLNSDNSKTSQGR